MDSYQASLCPDDLPQFTSYDNDGNVLQRIDGNGVTTNYVYNDPESLLTAIQYPATTSLNVSFTYDSYGRRAGMTDSTGSHSYTYGHLDELLSRTTTYTGIAGKTISFSYHPNGSRQSMTTPAGTFNYSYDAAGRPTSMTNPFSETTSWIHQNNDWLQTQTLQNGTIATYTYNAMGEVTRLLNQIVSTTISDFSNIAYDGFGNRTSVTASIPTATSLNGTTGYTYDTKNQLTQETSTRNGGFTDIFGYDSSGNPTTFKGVTKTYNSNNQQTGTGYAHDSNGNPTSYGGVVLTFDPANRMTAYGSLLSAGYTGDGLRAWKQNSTARTYFLYDGIVPVVEMDNTGAVSATNSFGPFGLVSRREGTTSVFYSFDSEGNVAHRSNASGTVLSNHLLDAYGAVKSGTITEPFGYKAQVGYYTDVETGLQLLTHRYYDPNTGRFLTRDPIGYDGGINLYSYVTNNPTNWIDPLGWAKLIYWRAQGDSKFGHISLLLDDGTYISYWPSRPVPKDALPYIHDVPPRLPANYEHDLAQEGGRAPLEIEIDGLDEEAIKKWWNNGRGHGDWGDLNNCADIVGEALRRGGLPVRRTVVYTLPEDIKKEVERLLRERRYPPPVPKPRPEPCRSNCK